MTREAGAPLVSIPQAPVPLDGQAYWLGRPNGARLRCALFHPPGRPRGSVVLSPGRTESIEKYYEVIAELQTRGFVVFSHDWRGQGLSTRFLPDRIKGHARGWRLFLGDFAALLDAFSADLPKPWIGLGHSMGAGLTLLALTEGERRMSAAVLSAPMIGVRTQGRPVARVRKWAWIQGLVGRASAYVFANPADPLHGEFQDNILTRDRVRWARWRDQRLACRDLQLGGLTWGWLAFALALAHRLERLDQVERIDIPFTIVAAGDDRLCVNAASRAVSLRAPHGRYVEVAGALHEILMETDARRAVFWREFDAIADAVAPSA